MTDLVRKIEAVDIPKLHELIELVFGDDQWENIERLGGGITNHSYKITRKDGQEYLARIPGDGTEEMINRINERKSTELGCKLGFDSQLLYFGSDGCKVMEFIHNPQPMNEEVMKRSENLSQAAEIYHKLHTCGIDTGVRFEVFEMAVLYEKIIMDAGVAFPDDYDGVKQTVMDIKAEVDKAGEVSRVPCHNDSSISNWIMDENGKLHLIDWEYSGMNEPMWDLSCLSIEADYGAAEDDELLNTYYSFEEKSPGVEEKRRFSAAKLYVDYLWTLWGLARVPFGGDFMREYSGVRYARLKKNIEAYKNLAEEN